MTITERQAAAESLARSPVVGPSKPRLLEVLI
jgi:hypothetical protein